MKTRKKQPGSLKRLLSYAGGHKRLTIAGCALSGVSAVLSIMPYVLVWFIARGVFAALAAPADLRPLAAYGWRAVGFALAGTAVYFAALMMTHLSAFRVARNMRYQAAKHLVNVPLGFFSAHESGRLRKQIDDNAGATETVLAHQLPDAVGAFVTPVACIALLFAFDWRMGLVCLVPIAVSMYMLARMMGGESAKFFGRYQTAIEELSAEATEYVRGIPVVKVFQQTVRSFKSFYRSILNYSKLATGYAMSCKGAMVWFTTLLNSAFLLLLPLTAILLGASGADGWGILADFMFYLIFTPFCAFMTNRLMYAAQAFREAEEAVRKLDAILCVKPLPEAAAPKPVAGTDIAFEHVCFTYPGGAAPALRDVSFCVPEGKTVALVGPSGGGKSTAAALIPRFWDVQSGSVKIGGVDVRALSSEELMRNVAFVFQDTRLFKTSLLENIRAARPDATLEQVKRAASQARCDDILSKLPEGLNTVIGSKGTYLSGGEQQRIALARAILKDAPIVVLDEATAFADPENEALIQKAFEVLARGKTVLLIAHRLSTVQGADEILLLDEGRILERGTHAALKQKGGQYERMWRDYQTAIQWKVERGSQA